MCWRAGCHISPLRSCWAKPHAWGGNGLPLEKGRRTWKMKVNCTDKGGNQIKCCGSWRGRGPKKSVWDVTRDEDAFVLEEECLSISSPTINLTWVTFQQVVRRHFGWPWSLQCNKTVPFISSLSQTAKLWCVDGRENHSPNLDPSCFNLGLFSYVRRST